MYHIYTYIYDFLFFEFIFMYSQKSCKENMKI